MRTMMHDRTVMSGVASLEAAGLVTTQHGKIVMPCPERLSRYGSRDEPVVRAARSMM